MSMRELVTGGTACAVPGSSSSSSSNPLGALANALIGSSSKNQGVLKEIPNNSAAAPHSQFYSHTGDPVAALPGSELDRPFLQSNAQGSEFIRGFRASDANGFADAWDEIQRQPPFDPVAGPAPPVQPSLDGLSQGDKQCIRDRSSIMARHIFSDRSEEFINSQVNALLSSLEIENDIHARGSMPGRFRELEDYWNESQGVMKPVAHPADGWVTEFSQNRIHHGGPDAWARSFEQQHGAGGWASEFEQEQAQLTSADQMRGVNMGNLAAIQQTRMLAHTLSQNGDPKFQVFRGPDQWANEFSAERLQQEPVDDQWVNEFSKLHVDDWAEEFGRQVGEGALGDDWANSYDEFINEQIVAKQRSDASRGVYVFSDMNPYVGHPNPLKEGQDLFRKGLLSEAVLALEAEVMKNPENAEGWRLLGITHAENDDDQQAIAAMMRAQEADPTNLEVLLSLGVSHTNELEQSAALKYLYGWLCHHPKYGTLAPPELTDSLYYADVARLFNEAAQMSPEDADVHIVLGVLYNLSREYDKAIAAFKTALKLKPNDYSLWNKLGATQANSVQSADAILAYQQALDLKPNYVRAWANMGISYANQGMYEESIRYYVRALAMNPKADNAWQYLRISLSCASRNDMVEACDSRNLEADASSFIYGACSHPPFLVAGSGDQNFVHELTHSRSSYGRIVLYI
ncbi:Peroxisome bioproteinsis protein 5 [Hibiscus syriacus]|uniref:Peroxisome bioproteinsis protein 5 n=1 Tax=Hibiscus syriacus TaxID=106335 RepID=A0A6A3C3P8_HIBSY|nr:Peroxisome bioproteinsis protein 5 [Hibiscus syriacus]